MFSLLLAIIYLSFISLGLPDSILGSAWPTMVTELGCPLSYAGIVTMIVAGGTIVSSLLSDKLTKRLGAGLVTSLSVLLTAISLLGFSLSNSFIMLCIMAVPYGLGAGAVDAALNNYVALHYASKHMSWLHCFWGVGATAGPYIMGYAISTAQGWRHGYGIISVLQFVLTFLIFLSLPLWKKRGCENSEESTHEAPLGIKDALKIKGVCAALLAFFGYCALETTAGLWASSYLADYRRVSAETAAFFASMFYIGITAGRFFSGFIFDKVGDKNMIRVGVLTMTLGTVLIAVPLSSVIPALAGLIIVGLGCAPVYPAIIHSTPTNFGKENSHAIVGIQMACAYLGSTLMPPAFGLVAQQVTIGLFPAAMAIFAGLLFVMTERVNKVCAKK